MMPRLLVITAPKFRNSVTLIAQVFAGLGLKVDIIDSSIVSNDSGQLLAHIEESQKFIVAIDSADTNSLLVSAYFLGRNNPFVLLKERGFDAALFENCNTVLVDDKLSPQELSSKVLAALDLEEDVESAPSDSREFLSWLFEDNTRIERLSDQHFERLCKLMLSNAGFHTGESMDFLGGDTLAPMEGKQQVFVECKNYASGKKVDIGTVMETVNRAKKRECDFVVFVTNAMLTSAAESYAKTCSPTFWHFGRDSLEALVKQRVSVASLSTPFETAWGLRPVDALVGTRTIKPHVEVKDFEAGISMCVPNSFSSRSKYPPSICAFVTRPADLSATRHEFSSWIDEGTVLWHNVGSLDIGNIFHDPLELRKAVNASSMLVIFDLSFSTYDSPERDALTCAARELAKDPRVAEKDIYILCNDSRESLRRLPAFFASSQFIEITRWYVDDLLVDRKQRKQLSELPEAIVEAKKPKKRKRK